MDIKVALNFAAQGETDVLDQVILAIKFENLNGKHYICMDRSEYTVYHDEKEVLLQAGLKAKVESFEVMNAHTDSPLTIFNLYISDASVKKEKRKITTDYVIPVIIYGV